MRWQNWPKLQESLFPSDIPWPPRKISDRLALAGANAVTHLGNGLPNLLPRHENFIWAVLANDHYTAMIISDGESFAGTDIKVDYSG